MKNLDVCDGRHARLPVAMKIPGRELAERRDCEAHKYGFHLQTARVVNILSLVYESAGLVKADGSRGGVDENIPEKRSGYHRLNMLKERMANASAL